MSERDDIWRAKDINHSRAIRRKSSAKFRLTHPATVEVLQKRNTYLRKEVMAWARTHHPALIRRLESEALIMFPSALVDEDYPERHLGLDKRNTSEAYSRA